MISYSKIIRQAWAITKRQRFLWWYGLLLFSGTAVDMYGTITSPEVADKMPGVAQFNPDALMNFRHAPLVLVLLFCLWLLIYFRSKAGIILSIRQALENQPGSFRKTFNESQNYFLRLVSLSILTQIAFLVSSIAIFSPVYYLAGQKAVTQSVFLGVLGGLLFAAFAFVIVFTGIFGAIHIVALKMKVIDAVRATIDLVGNLWRQLLFMGLLVVGILILAGVIASLLAAPFVVFAVLSYHSGGLGAVSALLFFMGMAVFWAVSGIFTAFYHTLWVVFFSEVVNITKLEEDEKIPEAEIAQ